MGTTDCIVFRRDRENCIIVHSSGGCVLIATYKRFTSHLITISNPSLMNLAIPNKSSNSKSIIVSIYIPPNNSVEIHKRHCFELEHLRLVFPCHTIFRDSDLPSLYWHNNFSRSVFAKLGSTSRHEQLFQFSTIINYENA